MRIIGMLIVLGSVLVLMYFLGADMGLYSTGGDKDAMKFTPLKATVGAAEKAAGANKETQEKLKRSLEE